MDVKAERDSTEFSLIRAGTFRLGTTSGTLPFKVRRLTGSPNCEARRLRDDDRVHVNELYRRIKRREINALLGKNSEKRSALMEALEWNLQGSGSDVNMVHLSLPATANIKPAMIDALADILFYTKKNSIIIPPFGSNSSMLKRRELFLEAIRERGDVSPGKELMGAIPAKMMATEVEILLQDYLEMGVKTFAVDVAGGNIPNGMLGRVNGLLDATLEGDYLLMVLGQKEIPRDATGQTAMANDVASVPLGYDGFAPNRQGFGSDPEEIEGMSMEEEARYKLLRAKDEKGRKRLFVPDSWGRVQVAAVLDEAPEMLSSREGDEYCTKTTREFNIINLFDDDRVAPEAFGEVLRCHDTELVEMELEEAGNTALEGEIESMVTERAWARSIIPRITMERAQYVTSLRMTHSQQRLG